MNHLRRFYHWVRSFFVKTPNQILPYSFPNTPDWRVAVHEAGHAVVAWYASTVIKVEAARYTEDGGIVNYSAQKSWQMAVIAMAGMAAEAITYEKFNTGASAQDLMDAKSYSSISANLIKSELHAQCSVDFSDAFSIELSKRELVTISAAYVMAKQMLKKHRARMFRLAVELYHQKVLLEPQLEQLLGPRGFTRALGVVKETWV